MTTATPTYAPALLNRSAAAAYIGVSLPTWKRLVAAGQIPAAVQQDGVRQRQWRREDLDRYVAGLPAAKPGQFPAADG